MALRDILVIGFKNLIYRRSSGVWDFGLAPPKSAGSPVGLDVDPDTGDILIAGTNTNRIYRYSGGSWDSGILIPISLLGIQGATGIAVHPADSKYSVYGCGRTGHIRNGVVRNEVWEGSGGVRVAARRRAGGSWRSCGARYWNCAGRRTITAECTARR